jgi:polyhydroxyalkanoate synthase
MNANPFAENDATYAALARDHSALQHKGSGQRPKNGPRPLPLFLSLLQNHYKSAPDEAQRALNGLKKLQSAAPIILQQPMQTVAHAAPAVLYDYGGTGPKVVFVPSLINPPSILDITEDRSLLCWLSKNGIHPYLVAWGDVGKAEADLGISDYIADILVPLLQKLDEPVQLVGYCLGGTMALAAAHLYPVQSLTLIAAPWHFARYPESARASMAKLWAGAEPVANQLGYLPMEMLQLMFWQLDPAGTVQKYARFAALSEGSEEAALFVAMEQWANGGAPLSYAAARELFEDFIANNTPGEGAWHVKGQCIAPASLPCPIFEIVSRTDRIVPAATASGVSNRLELNRGHVGMITGSQAKAQLWTPLREWLSHTHKNC